MLARADFSTAAQLLESTATVSCRDTRRSDPPIVTFPYVLSIPDPDVDGFLH
jgi:hypothetical protein